uniref:Letm1 RBD domain-containing protein n=1 Tax=Panagrellus redivivus TaxID=6233 RepID=A0A7E4WBA0_PANRE
MLTTVVSAQCRLGSSRSGSIFVGSLRMLSSQPPAKSPGLMQRYENYLEQNWPKAYQMHRMVIDGCKSCIGDVKTYYFIRRDLGAGKIKLSDLSRQQLETYIQCPSELFHLLTLITLLQIPLIGDALIVMVLTNLHTRPEIGKLIAIVVIAPLPLAIYLFAFAIIFFPRHVLTRHFWSKHQKREYWSLEWKKKASYHYPALVDAIKATNKITVPASLSDITTMTVPKIKELDFSQVYHLARVHRFFPVNMANSLRWRAEALKHLDAVLLRESGDIDKMDTEELQTQLYIRCLKFSGKSDDEMRTLLRTWLKNSAKLAERPSLYLHAPVLHQYKPRKSKSD